MLIPSARWNDRSCPLEIGERSNAAWLGDEVVPCVAAGIHDRPCAGEQPPRQVAVAQVLPGLFDGVQLGRVGRQLRGDLLEQQVHRRDRDVRQNQRGAGIARGADRAEDLGRAVALVLDYPRPHAALEPAADHAALLPHTGLVLEPDLDALGLGVVGLDLREGCGEALFLNASWAARSVSACRGRGVCQDRSRSCISRPMPVSL